MGHSNNCGQRFGPWWHYECLITKISNPNGENFGLGTKITLKALMENELI